MPRHLHDERYPHRREMRNLHHTLLRPLTQPACIPLRSLNCIPLHSLICIPLHSLICMLPLSHEPAFTASVTRARTTLMSEPRYFNAPSNKEQPSYFDVFSTYSYLISIGVRPVTSNQ